MTTEVTSITSIMKDVIIANCAETLVGLVSKETNADIATALELVSQIIDIVVTGIQSAIDSGIITISTNVETYANQDLEL